MPVAACIGVPSPWAPSTSVNGFIASGTSARCDWPSAPLYTRHIFGMLAVLSADLDAVLLQRVVAQLEPQPRRVRQRRSEEHTSELQSRLHLVCRLLLEKKKKDHEMPGRASTLP